MLAVLFCYTRDRAPDVCSQDTSAEWASGVQTSSYPEHCTHVEILGTSSGAILGRKRIDCKLLD